MADSNNIFLKFQEWSLGNRDAYDVMAEFHKIAHLIDDMVDGDVEADQRSQAMLQILEFCLVRVTDLPFYANNFLSYRPVVMQALLLYDEANRLEKEPDEELKCAAFVFRGSEELIYYHTAYLVGGLEHAVKVREEYRRLWMMNDTFEEWKQEHS